MRVAAVVLAAGLSSRMGRFKPLLPLGAGTVLSMAVETFHAAGVDDVVVVTGRRGRRVAEAARDLGVRAAHNPDYEQGMYTSVLAGVRALPPDAKAFFLLPVDIPLVRPSTVTLLVQDFAAHGAAVTHPRFLGERGHPPLMRADLAGAVLAHDGTGGLRTVLDRFDGTARDVDVADAGVCFDLDTPADYERALERAPHLATPSSAEIHALWDMAATPAPTRAHCRAVAAAARAMAEALGRRIGADEAPGPEAVEAAALLHDVAKARKRHEQAGGRLLERHGFAALAGSVAAHRDLELAPEAPFGMREVVFLADKVVRGTEAVPLDERYGMKLRQWSHDPDAVAAIGGRRNRARVVAARFKAESGQDAFELASAALERARKRDELFNDEEGRTTDRVREDAP